MKSNFYTIVGIIGLFFFSLPIRLFAATEYDPGAIHVDTLPECNQSVVNNVYALSTDNHYWKCNLIPGGLRTLEVGDDLKDISKFYFNFPETQDFFNALNNYYPYDSARGGFVQDNMFIITESAPSNYGQNVTMNFFVYAYESTNRIIGFRSNNSPTYFFQYMNGSVSRNWDYMDFPYDSRSYDYSSHANYVSGASKIISIDKNSPVYQYIKISTADRYEYEDLGSIPELYTYEDKDFYLFYDFGMIANLDIFSNYDFTSFTDYQKVVVVIGFNVFYIAILCFFGAIIYKTIARIIRFILG